MCLSQLQPVLSAVWIALHSGPGGVRYPVFLQCIVIILNLYLVLTKAAVFV